MARLEPKAAAREALRGFRAYLQAKGIDPKESEYWIKRVAKGFEDQALREKLTEQKRKV